MKRTPIAKRLVALLVVSILMVAFMAPIASAADEWPGKTLEIVVPYKAGGDTDFHARKLAEYLEPLLDTTIVITNIEGASGSIGMMEIMNADPDGSRMLYFHESMLTNYVSGLTDFAHEALDVCAATVVDDTYVLAVKADSPYQTLGDLVADAKERPGEISFAGSLSGFTYYVARMLEYCCDMDLNVCDAGGTGDRSAAILSGKMDVTAHVYGGLKAYIDSGEMRVLCVLGEERSPLFPDVETAGEAGYPELVLDRAYFLSFPKGTDPEIIKKMSDAIGEVCREIGDEKIVQFRYKRNGCGTPGHIRIGEAEEMAQELAAFIEERL